MKETYYFSHDCNARNDEKILMLRADYGMEGYGVYWALVEMMFESSETCLYHNKVKGIAVSYNIDITVLKSVITTCINEGLFDSDTITFWSESLRRRKGRYHEIKEQKSEAGKKGMAKRWGTDNTVITPLLDSNITDITKHNKGKEIESKLKEIKDIYMDYVHLTPTEYNKLLDKLTEEERNTYIERVNDYIGQIGIARADKLYKSHYHVILNWHRKDVKEKPLAKVVTPLTTYKAKDSDRRL